jgi:predicted RNA-binding Zn-ribbon protein involved in translation (DUF1610 family)
MILTEDEMRQCEDATVDGVCEGTCNECGYSQPVEPDASYPCPECGNGKLQSILRKYGII